MFFREIIFNVEIVFREKESETLLSKPKVPAEPIVIAEEQQKEVEKPKLDTASVFSPKEKPAAAKPAFTGFFAAENKKEDEKEPAPAFKGLINFSFMFPLLCFLCFLC